MKQQASDEFETVGFYEELIETEHPHKCIGTRRLPAKPDRPLGYEGRVEITFTEPFEVSQGHKTKTIRASQKRPVKVWSMAQRICGRVVAK